MNLADLRSIHCPSCGGPSDLLGWLDRAAHIWPSEHRVRAACPRCDAHAHLELGNDEAAIGQLSEGPRPLFQPNQRVQQPGLVARASPDGLEVLLLNRHFVWGAGPTPA